MNANAALALDTTQSWVVSDYDFYCEVQYCYMQCNMNRAIATGDTEDVAFILNSQ